MEKPQGSKKVGDVKPMQITNQDISMIKEMKDKINSKLGVNHESYEIVSISGQTVAGTNKFFNLRGKPGNKEYTINIMAPVGEKVTPLIQESSMGFKPHQQGFSEKEEVQH